MTLAACGGTSADIAIAGGFNVSVDPAGSRGAAPAFSGESLRAGDPVSSTAMAGKVGVINFWGSWCGPCRREEANLEALWKEYGPRGAVFIGVNTRRDQRAAAIAFLDEFKVTYPSIYNPDSRIAYRYGIRFMPATVIVDRQGRRAATIVGAIENQVDVRKILDAELAR